MAKVTRPCLYCGKPTTKGRRGEHIIPEVIGGELTLLEVGDKWVCTDCNNGRLSVVDKELCNRSQLSVIASQELSSSIWQMWDVDHGAKELLIEARPQWEEGQLRSIYNYPQMIFETAGPQIRGDAEEMGQFGKQNTINVMVRAVYSAYERYNAGKKGALNFERVRTDLSTRGYRLPPRVYSPHSLQKIGDDIQKTSFVLRFITDRDRKFALRAMSQLTSGHNQQFNRTATFLGSAIPSMSLSFDVGRALRGMMKIAVNLLAAHCTKMVVNRDTFPDVIKLILGERHPDPVLLQSNGFVHAKDIQSIAQKGCHSFRLISLNGGWVVLMSFFGGRIGCVASFPGGNQEHWNTLDVVAPIRSKEWKANKQLLALPMNFHVEWRDHKLVTPSLDLHFSQSRMIMEEMPVRRP